ncbi:Pentatricopeptide repeat-containing protein [Actinidia chinensis var. chinensis]|uniref:Pentatricopeptide repeat-containing protein n=1 Tax=Actinidia chinensis var. chinensis TaxID=1590841 RepID=A0A2R6R6K0_ACTCC|nr:Pentatricopeptide repeat-containing protein [Actinidia chinensis var. chinensis]
MILKLGMTGNVDEMEGFCNEMVKEGFVGSEEALVALIDVFVKHGRVNEALRVLVTMNSGRFKPSIGVFNLLLGALVEEKRDFQDVLFVYKEMVKAAIVPTTDTLNYLMEALFEADRVDTALDQYRRMSKKRCFPNSRTYDVLISGLVARNRVDESINILNEMFEVKFEPSLSFYSSVIPIFCRLSKLEVGMKLFKMMKASILSPDSYVYEVLVLCLCDHLRLHDAINVVEEMTSGGLTPSDDILVHIINCFCKLGNFDEATKFLEDKHVLSSHPHNALLGGYCDVGNFLAAKVLFANMLERNIADTVSWNILIRWLSENVRINKALEFLCRMIVSSYVPDSATYSAVVVGKCRLHKYKDALDLFHHACAKSWVLDCSSYAELVECLSRSGMIQAAEVFHYMSNYRCALQSSSFIMLIKGLCETGNVDRAIRLLPSAYYSGTSCSTAMYNTIMLGLSESGKVNDLLVVLSRMLVEGCTLDGETYCTLIESMIAVGRTEDCIVFFNLMASEGLSPDSETLSNLLSCLGKHSQLHKILLAIDRLALDREMLDSAMYNVLVNGLWKEGHKTEACRLLDTMLEKGWVPDATTHGLLMGSIVREDAECKLVTYEDIDLQDRISSILAEGLGET